MNLRLFIPKESNPHLAFHPQPAKKLHNNMLTGIEGTTDLIESTFKALGKEGFAEQFLHHFE